jgi:hypothetical protein
MARSTRNWWPGTEEQRMEFQARVTIARSCTVVTTAADLAITGS